MKMKNIVDDLLDGEGFRRYDLRLYQKTKYCASRPSVSENKLGEEGRYRPPVKGIGSFMLW